MVYDPVIKLDFPTALNNLLEGILRLLRRLFATDIRFFNLSIPIVLRLLHRILRVRNSHMNEIRSNV